MTEKNRSIGFFGIGIFVYLSISSLAEVLEDLLKDVFINFGLEPLWKVVVFGGVAVFILFKLVINGLVTVVVPPIPKFPFAIAYSLIILESLAFIWLGISLWRSGVKIPSIAWKVFAYTAAVLCLLFGTLGSINQAFYAHDKILQSSEKSSVLDFPSEQ